MKVVIIYESCFGNTLEIAESLWSALRKDTDVRLLPASEAQVHDLRGIDMLFIGCPTREHTIAPATRALLEQLPTAGLRDVRVAVFDTRYRRPRWLSGSAAEGVARHVRALAGHLVSEPESFFVLDRQGPLAEGERERAAAWAAELVLADERMAA